MLDFSFSDRKNWPTFIWQGVVFLAIIWSAVEAPLSYVNGSIFESTLHLWAEGIICGIFALDIIFRIKNKFIPPKIDEDDNPYAEKKAEVPYHKTFWLPVDIFVSIPFDIIVTVLGLDVPMRILAAIRLFRVIRVTKLRNMFGYIDFLPKSVKLVLVLSAIMLGIHWIACGWMLLMPNPELDPMSAYNLALYWAVTTLTTVGYGDITPASNISRIYTMFVMMIGVGSYGIIIGNFSRMIMLADKYKEEKKEKMTSLHGFLKHYSIPKDVQSEVFSFYNHLLAQKVNEQDNEIMNDLPPAIQQELKIYMKIRLIRDIHVFHGISLECLKMLAEKLEHNFHSPNDMIVKTGDVGNEMFIIGHGSVEVLIGGNVVATLNPGDFFGEIALLEKTTRNADIRSKAYCDLYTLSKKSFLEVTQAFPSLDKNFREIYEQRKVDNKARNAKKNKKDAA